MSKIMCTRCGDSVMDQDDYLCPSCREYVNNANKPSEETREIDDLLEWYEDHSPSKETSVCEMCSGLVLTLKEVEQLVTIMLKARQGEILNDEVIKERSRNITSALRGYIIES